MVPDNILRRIDELQLAYIDALDSKNLAGWLGTFQENAAEYYVIPIEHIEQDLPLSLLHDDCYARLLDRVTFIEKIWVGIFEDYQMRHFVQRVRVQAADASDTYDVKSNVSVMYTDNEGHAHVLAIGTYEDRVRVNSDGACFVRKRVILDNFTTPRYIVYPL
jgi:3-phenylpropionate/cinnamic acid dioxygenase small subunit